MVVKKFRISCETLSFLSIFLLSSSVSNANQDIIEFPDSVTHSNVTTAVTITTSINPPAVQSSENSMNSGLRVLYDMTDKFLDVVQPPGKNLYDELEVEKAMNSTSNDPLAAWEKALRSKKPQFFLSYFAGFAVCLAFGAVFVIVMPIVGIFLCSCRCCCNACGHEDTGSPEKPRDRPMRICLGITLLIFTIIILAGAICAFMSNELVRRQTTSSDDDDRSRDVVERPLLSAVISGLGEIDTFKQKAIQESKNLLEQTNYTIYMVLDRLYDFPHKATVEIKRLLRTDQLLYYISILKTTLANVIDSLKMVDENYRLLSEEVQSLNESLMQLEKNLTQLCNMDPSRRCSVPKLTIDDGFYQILPFNVSNLLATLEPFANNGINTSMLDDINISNQIRKDMQPVFDAVNQVNISGIVIGVQESIESYAGKIPSLDQLMKKLNDTKKDVEKYGTYRFNVCVAISSFLLLIVLLNVLSLCVGAFAKPPYDRASSSGLTRWTAGYCLLASVTLMFTFCFVLMIIVALLFVSGGVVYTEGCRGFNNGDKNNAIVKTADAFLRTELRNVSFYGILRDCEQNVGIVEALNLDRTFNITGQLNLQNLKNLELKKNFSFNSIDLSALTESKSKLNEIKEIPDIADIQKQLNDSVTKALSTLANAIAHINETAESSADPQPKQGLRDAAERLQFLSDTFGAKISEITNRLQDALLKLNASLYFNNSSKSFTEFVQEVSEFVDVLTNRTKYELPELLRQLIGNTSSEIESAIESTVLEAKTQMLTSVGRCGPVSNAVKNVYSSACYSTLNPYNAFWFSYGWCVFFFIPTIAVAVTLATLYLRSEDENLSCYEAYKSTDDYFRLQNMTTPEHGSANSRHGNRVGSAGDGNYASNPGYVDDDGILSRYQGNGSSGMNYYRDVGRSGDVSNDNRSYPDANGFHIQRPMVQDNNSYDSNDSSRHRF